MGFWECPVFLASPMPAGPLALVAFRRSEKHFFWTEQRISIWYWGFYLFKKNEVKIETLGQLELSKMRCLICILLNFKYSVSCVLSQIKHICTVLLLITLFFFLLLPNICWIMFLGSDRKNCWDSSFLMLFVKKILYWKLCWVLSKSSHTDKVVTKIIFWMKSTIILKSEIWFKISSGYFCV